MAKTGKKGREDVFLECSECKNRNYRTSKSTKEATKKVALKKYCRFCKKHTDHKEKKK